ncbi:hypothetical protein [Dyadobacter sp. CY312]|uniref:hypothetical protein n=1 Tax=Dyadobacter sp. CY312 TaxID=2907303 RepID=UPI001F257430|nr:hypothetical protein [Dyadobacter sp. CY312]MCE7040544.1 hypothetical protein [Dyadobacter sp. CY312]
MYTAVKGTFENGQVTLEEPAPTLEKTKVVVMFLPDSEVDKSDRKPGVRIGSLANKGYGIPDDFNEPLDDLKDYM